VGGIEGNDEQRRIRMKLFRPVGLQELALIWDSGMRHFPPRLPHQPIFYPVASEDYARQIAKEWNTRDEGSGFAGYVTQFVVSDSYIERFEQHAVGSLSQSEFWIPAAELANFNASLNGLISVPEAFFGKDFRGWIPESLGLKGKDIAKQFAIMSEAWDWSRMDFVLEVSANRKTFYLNFLFWARTDFTREGITPERRDATIERLRQAWGFYPTEIPLPGPYNALAGC
jgi:hypothetical protein